MPHLEVTVRTPDREALVDITSLVQEAVESLAPGFSGATLVFVPHTTAGVIINEGADASVAKDILATLGRLVPKSGPYQHREGNSDAHIKSSLVGVSQFVLISGGRLLLGTWQGIFFCEFDGPRRRKLHVKITAG